MMSEFEEGQIIMDYYCQNVTRSLKGKLGFLLWIPYHLSLQLFWWVKSCREKERTDAEG